MSIDRGEAAALFERYRQPILFILVGMLNTAVGYGLFAILFLLTQSHRIALVIATILSVLFNFFSTGRIVFGNRSGSALVPFILGYAVTLGVNFVLLELLVHAGVNPLVAQAVCLPVVVVLGYLINSRIVFKNKNA
jgi:putative flippase GtrA